MDEKEKEWTLRELAAETGVPERTIRFYISRELLDPPLRAGRGAAYGPGHKARIEEIRKLQAKGLMLAEIAHALKLEREGSEVDRVMSVPRLEEASPAYSVLRMERPEPTPAPTSALPAPEDWRAYGIADDAVVMLRAGAAPWRTRRLLAALRQFAAMINDDKGNDPKEGDDE